MGKSKKKQRSEFLDDDCGQNALQLVARGSTIVAELLRLSEYIPDIFKDPSKQPHYKQIMCDFKYFSYQDEFEKAIQDSAELLQRDDDFRVTHMELLDRFFKLFRGVYGYVMELNRFIDEIKEGLYISQNLESILVNTDGKQLLCEIFHLYGVMLLLLDYRIGGKTREYLIVSYIRYKGAGEQNTVEITNMCRNTGYKFDQPLPKEYPVSYFNRVPIDKEVVGMLIGRLRSDDVYQMAYNYPIPEHRSTALAQQAAMLYVLLFFRPEILRNERPIMREIVDKHFADNWVISYYMGFTVDLTVAWEHFPAARQVIAGTVCMDTVTYHQLRMRKNVSKVNKEIAGFLREGVLTEQFALDNIHSTLLPCIREANVTLRWFILHMTRGPRGRRHFDQFKECYEHVSNQIDTNDILTLLMQTAQLEYDLKVMFEKFLKEKRSKWDAAKEQGVKKMSKLATFFSGEHVLSDNVRVEQLESWFSSIAERIEGLEYSDSTTASRKIQKLMHALEQVLEFHQIDTNLQVVQFVHDTRHLLRQMIRYINIETKVLITIGTVGDLSYGWELMSYFNCFVPEIQKKIKDNPHLAIQMRSTFVKLASLLEVPCTRIHQAAGNDALLTASLESVSEYYSSELVVFVRKVLHIIPTSIFAVLKEIVRILVDNLKECPTKLPRKELKDQSQLETRQRLSHLTADISKYANGILAMETTLVGIIQVDPHRLLEDGIRKELTKQITDELHRAIPFDSGKAMTAVQFDTILTRLSKLLKGIRQSFEYIQDYVNVHGLRVWIEEFSRIVNFNVEMECNAFMQKKLYPWNSKYQSESIPIPYFQPESEGATYSFLGNIVRNLLTMTDPRATVYVPALGAWYGLQSFEEIVGTRTFNALTESIGTPGLSALDRLMCFIITKDLQTVIGKLRKQGDVVSTTLTRMKQLLSPDTGIPVETVHIYTKLLQSLPPTFATECSDVLVRIGRLQLLRSHIANELRSNAKLDSGPLFWALTNANQSLLADLGQHYDDPEAHQMPGSIIAELSPFLDCVGISDSHSKVYVTAKPISELCFLLVAIVVAQLDNITYDDRLCCLTTMKRGSSFDAVPFASGLATLLKQFHSDVRHLLFGHLLQRVRASLCDFDHMDDKQKQAEVLPQESYNVMAFIDLLRVPAAFEGDDFHRVVPPQLFGEARLKAPQKKK